MNKYHTLISGDEESKQLAISLIKEQTKGSWDLFVKLCIENRLCYARFRESEKYFYIFIYTLSNENEVYGETSAVIDLNYFDKWNQKKE